MFTYKLKTSQPACKLSGEPPNNIPQAKIRLSNVIHRVPEPVQETRDGISQVSTLYSIKRHNEIRCHSFNNTIFGVVCT